MSGHQNGADITSAFVSFSRSRKSKMERRNAIYVPDWVFESCFRCLEDRLAQLRIYDRGMRAADTGSEELERAMLELQATERACEVRRILGGISRNMYEY